MTRVLQEEIKGEIFSEYIQMSLYEHVTKSPTVEFEKKRL